MAKKGKARSITEATAKQLATAISRFKLKMVIGKDTGVPAIIYAKNFKKATHTGLLDGKKLTPEAFIKYANKQGYVIATDGKYVRPWTSDYFTKKTGLKTKAKSHKRGKPTFEELKAKAKKMGLKKWTKKKSKRALAASIKRAVHSPKKHKKVKKVKAGKKGKGKFAALKKKAEASDEE